MLRGVTARALEPRSYAVTAVGPDAPGEIAALAEALAGVGANLEDASMTRLRGHFAMTVVVTADADAAHLELALHRAVGEVLHVTVRDLAADQPSVEGPGALPHRVTLHGADRPGLVAALARTLASHGGNITDLGCRLVGDLYVMTLDVDLPVGAPGEVAAQLARLAGELGVTIHLLPLDTDEL